MKHDPMTVLNLIAQTIYDKKGINTLALDIRGISTITDFVMIAEGNVDKHVISLASAIVEALELIGEKPRYIEGWERGDWVVLDFMVHLFTPRVRDKYQLEQLWKEGRICDLNIILSHEPSDVYARVDRK